MPINNTPVTEAEARLKVTVETTEGEKQTQAFINKMENKEININVDLSDVKKALELISSFTQKMSDAFDKVEGLDFKFSGLQKGLDDALSKLDNVTKIYNKGKSGEFEAFRVSVVGLDKIKEVTDEISDSVRELNGAKINTSSFEKLYSLFERMEGLLHSIVTGMNFDSIRPSKQVQDDIDRTTKKLEELAEKEQRIKELEEYFNTPNKKGNRIGRQVLDWSDTNDISDAGLNKLILNMREYISLGGDLSKIRLRPDSKSHFESFADVFDKLKNAGKIEIDTSSVGNDIQDIENLRNKIHELNEELLNAQNRENRDLTVSFGEQTANDFAASIQKALSNLEGLNINIPEGFSFEGLSSINIEEIITRFDTLLEVANKIFDKLNNNTEALNKQLDEVEKKTISVQENLSSNSNQTALSSPAIDETIISTTEIQEETAAIERQTAALNENAVAQERVNDVEKNGISAPSMPAQEPRTAVTLPVEEETGSLGRLQSKLHETADVVDEKTAAFQREQQVVDGVIDHEILRLQELSGWIFSIINDLEKIKNTPIDISIQFDGEGGASQLEQLKDLIKNVGSAENIGTLKEILEALTNVAKGTSSGDSSYLAQLKNILNFLSGSRADAKLEQISKNLGKFSDALKEIDGADSDFIKSISNILEKSEQLKDLASVVKETRKKMKQAEDAVNGKKSGKKDVDEKVAAWNKLAKMEKEYQLLIAKAGNNDITKSERLRLAELKVQYEKLEKVINGVTAATEEQVKAHERFENAKSIAWAVTSEYNAILENPKPNRQIPGLSRGWFEQNTSDTIYGLNKYSDDYVSKLREARKELLACKDAFELIEKKKLVGDKDFKKLEAAVAKVKYLNAQAGSSGNKGINDNSYSKLMSKMQSYAHEISGASLSVRKELDSMIFDLERIGNTGTVEELKRIGAQFDSFQGEVRRSGQQVRSFFDIMSEKVRYQSAEFFARYFSAQDIIRYAKQAFEISKEYDTALTEMRKVTDESVQSLKEYQQASFDVADTVGTTSKQIQLSTADFLRLGQSFDKASRSAQDANILLNVSEFENIDEATDSLIAMSQAYQELTNIEIIDRLNNIGKKIA